MTGEPAPDWERIEKHLDPAGLVVWEAEQIIKAETLKGWSSEHSDPLADVIAFKERLDRRGIWW